MKKVLIDTTEKRWYELLEEEGGAKEGSGKIAEELWKGEVSAWTAERAKHETGDDRYMQQVVKSGTLSDKVAAMTLLVQESPVHRFETLQGLVGLAKSGSHASKMAIESLKELFSGQDLLPDSRRLRIFSAAEEGSKVTLILRFFESRLRDLYAEVVSLIEGYTKHSGKELRTFAIDSAAHLLASKPEQEAKLLSVVVNKLGDPDGAASTAAVRALCRVLDKHKAMTSVVCAEVQGFAARQKTTDDEKNLGLYRAITFLSQVYLSPELSDVAESMVDMYVALFGREVKKGELKTKLLSALLTGLNRALPYVGEDALDKMGGAASSSESTSSSEKSSSKTPLDSLFLVTHTGTLAARIQALSLLERMTSSSARSKPALRARFYRSVYALMHSDEIRKTTKPTLFLNLCFKALKNDDDPNRFAACVKRLAQLASHSTASVAAAVVFLVAAVQDRSFASGKRRARQLVDEANVVVDSPSSSPPPSSETVGEEWRDALKREPMYACGPTSRLWELSLMRHHYHPSVTKFAETTLASSAKIDYKGDPLDDFTLSNFLDRFAYRNPKPQKTQRHAKTRSSNNALDLHDSYDFYAKYVEDAATFKAAKLVKKLPAENEDDGQEEDEDDDDDDDAFEDDDVDLSDDDDDVDDDSDEEDSAASDDELMDAPTPIGEENLPRSVSKKRKSPFVDAEEYMEQVERKAAKQSTKIMKKNKKKKA